MKMEFSIPRPNLLFLRIGLGKIRNFEYMVDKKQLREEKHCPLLRKDKLFRQDMNAIHYLGKIRIF